MKAIVYEKGKPSYRLLLREVEKPVPSEQEVLIRVEAVGMNAADYRCMQLGVIPKKKIFGADVAGRVEAVGKGIQRLKVGDEVVGELASYGFGGLAEYAVAPERLLALKPSGLSWVESAAVPMAALTALQGLRDLGKIQPGQKVLICGAGGGVGTFAVQLARYYGANVTAVCGPRNVDQTRSLGAQRVIDYSKEDFTTDAARYDLVLVVNGRQSLAEYRRVIAPRGTLVMAGGALTQVFGVMAMGWLHTLTGKKMLSLSARVNGKDLDFILGLVKERKIVPIIERTCPLEETAQAVESLRQGHARGKLVILPQATGDRQSTATR